MAKADHRETWRKQVAKMSESDRKAIIYGQVKQIGSHVMLEMKTRDRIVVIANGEPIVIDLQKQHGSRGKLGIIAGPDVAVMREDVFFEVDREVAS